MMRIIQLTITLLCISNANAVMRQRYTGRSGLRSSTRRQATATDKTIAQSPKRRNLQTAGDEDSSDDMCGKGKGKSGNSGKAGKAGKADRKLQSGCIQDSGLFFDSTLSNSSATNSGDENSEESTPSTEGEPEDSTSNDLNTTVGTIRSDEFFNAVDGNAVLGLENTISDPLPLGSPQNGTGGELEEIPNDAEISNDVRN